MSKGIQTARRAGLRGTALATFAFAAAAGAQSTPSLDDALQTVARQSGREIIYPADATRGRAAPSVAPDTAPDDAIRELVRGTGLKAEFRPGVIVLRQSGPRTTDVAADPPAEAATVVVTATRIRGEQASSPVTTVDRREIEVAGLSDLGEVMRRLPQNFGGGQNPSVIGGGNQGGNINATSSSNVNLRGLGEDATLTLVNGHRVATDGLSQGIDVSAIPVAAIARVEVVADGASALHGSDAVGGVVNVILRPGYSGLQTSARVGTTFDGGDEQEQFGAVTGVDWRSGGVMLAGAFIRNGRIDASQRDYTARLNPTLSLFPYRRQVAGVGTAHQRLGIATFALDAEYGRRESSFSNPFFVNAATTVNGLISRPTVDFYAVTPSVRIETAGGWSANLTGTQSTSVAVLGNSRFSQSMQTALRLRYRNQLQTGELGVEGPIVALPGGEVRLAAGGGLRSLDLRVRNTSSLAGVTRTTADYGGGRDIAFGYGELSLPVVGPQNAGRLARTLRLDAAARYEDYRGLTHVLTPKLGVIYEPIAGATLKGTWGRSFKAPTLFQENQVGQGALIPGSFFVGVPAGRTILLLGGGGNPLRPERAETWSGTLELRPSSALKLSGSYYDVRFRDRVTTAISNVLSVYNDPRFADLVVYNPSSSQLDAFIATLPQGLANQTGQPYNPASVAAVINNGLQNLARQHVRGVDVSLGYKATLPGGQKIGVDAAVTYLDSDQRLSAGQAIIQRAGTIFDPPHWRGRMAATWERDGLTLASFANYSGENLDDRYVPNGTVGSFVTFDASVRARAPAGRGVLRGLEAGITILNLTDEKPSPIPNLNPADPPYDSTNSSVLGRTVSVSLTKSW